MENSLSLVYIVICLSYFIFIICKCWRNRNGQGLLFWCRTRREGDDSQLHNNNVDYNMQNLQAILTNYLSNRTPSHGMNSEQRRVFILDRLVVQKAKDSQELNLEVTNDQETHKEAKYEVISMNTSEKQSDGMNNLDHDASYNNDDDNDDDVDYNDVEANIQAHNEEEDKNGDEEDQQCSGTSEDTLIEESDTNDEENGHSHEQNGDEKDQLSIHNNDITITEPDRPSPLKAILEGFQNSIVSSEPKKENEMEKEPDNVCPICLAEFEGEEDICKSKNEECQHVFHLDCMMEWLMKHDECPLCRCDYLKKPANDDNDDENRGWARRVIGPGRYSLASSLQQSGNLIVLRRNTSIRFR